MDNYILKEKIKRQLIIRKARDRYKDVTNNITEALRLYLENDATEDEQIPVHITMPEINKLKEILKTNRPKCEECDGDLQMQQDAVDINGTLFPTAWFCKCGRIEYSEKTPKEWLEILRENRG